MDAWTGVAVFVGIWLVGGTAFALLAFARRLIRFVTAPVSAVTGSGCGGVAENVGAVGLRGSASLGAIIPSGSDEDRSRFSFIFHSKQALTENKMTRIAQTETTLSEET